MLVQIDVVARYYLTKNKIKFKKFNFIFFFLILEDNILDQKEEIDDYLILQNEH